MPPRLLDLARLAKDRDLVFTIDAEEADRLELSLDVFARVVDDPSLCGWDGFGLAVQAYQKRAMAVIDYVASLAEAYHRRFMVRLVKGAYWDSEIKRAQERGLADYPVFTRKAMTDLNFDACAARLLDEPRLFPQFATHNARTVAAVLTRAGAGATSSFSACTAWARPSMKRCAKMSDAAVRIYAPVGPHRDLLAYLVRRLIENGANSSFVARAADPETPESALVADPHDLLGDGRARHPRLPLPGDIYLPQRANSNGVEFGDGLRLRPARRDARAASRRHRRAPGVACATPPRDRSCRRSMAPSSAPSSRRMKLRRDAAIPTAARAFPDWPAHAGRTARADDGRAADFIEARRGPLIALLQNEAGKTLDDALAEVREAADLCRYYAGEARMLCAGKTLPGPTGEANVYAGRARRLCLHFALEFPAGDFCRPDRRGAGHRQLRRRQAGRADAARRRRGDGSPA